MKKNKETIKKNICVTVDMTDMTKLPSQTILEIQNDLKSVDTAVEEVKEEVVNEVVANKFTNLRWYNKLWNTIKSIF